MNKRVLVAALYTLSLLIGLAYPFQASQIANAAPVTGFNPGNIIDDAVFTKNNAMNVTEIQNFLNSKVPSCDTQGTQPSEYGGGTRAQWAANASLHPNIGAFYPPFTCLKDYSENGQTAAQIIYNIAQQYKINPQVFIVLLQKEQGLVTDTWPLSNQYQKATGYGCPDNSVCDSQYFGLTNQLNQSGRMFRAIFNNSPNWYSPYVIGTNNILWNPVTSCGSSSVGIENHSTQALYDYTPYRPNQAALNAGYGTGDSCSSYGNRNFYLYFTDWFGSIRYTFGPQASSTSLYARSACTIAPFNDTMIGRLYNPDTRDFLYTRSFAEACQAVKYGYIWDDIVMKSATGPDAIPIYRLANYERHIFTSDINAKNTALNEGYKDEGIGFYAYSTSATGRTPVYGLQSADTFFITSSGKEAETYNQTYNYYLYGTVFYTDSLTNATATVNRFVRNNQRIYTPSQTEGDNALRYGFAAEGSVSTNDLAPNAGDLPIFRIRTPDGTYLYTMSRLERDIAVIYYNCTAEGIPFYSLAWSNTPVYRASNPYNGFRIYASNMTEYNDATSHYSYVGDGIGWYGY